MQAIILAGGKGTRLRPLTLDLPKPVVPLVNRPMIFYQLDLLEAAGITDITLSLSYQPGRIRDLVAAGRPENKVRYVVEDEPLGTGGAVRYALDPEGGTIVVFNGDIINDLDLSAVLDFHRRSQAGVTIVLAEVQDPTNYGLVTVHPNGRVKQFLEKPGWDEVDGRAINAGTYVIEPRYLDLIRMGSHVSIEREFFPLLVERNEPFYAYLHHGYWMDVGTVGKYLQAHADFFARGELPAGCRETAPGLWLEEGAVVEPGVEVSGSVVVGAGSVVERGAVLSRFNVIGRECRVAGGTHLDGCILWDRVVVGADSRLKHCVLGEGSRVGRNVHLAGLFALGNGGVLPDFSHFTEMDDLED